jgi:hypothetical protein
MQRLRHGPIDLDLLRMSAAAKPKRCAGNYHGPQCNPGEQSRLWVPYCRAVEG